MIKTKTFGRFMNEFVVIAVSTFAAGVISVYISNYVGELTDSEIISKITFVISLILCMLLIAKYRDYAIKRYNRDLIILAEELASAIERHDIVTSKELKEILVILIDKLEKLENEHKQNRTGH